MISIYDLWLGLWLVDKNHGWDKDLVKIGKLGVDVRRVLIDRKCIYE